MSLSDGVIWAIVAAPFIGSFLGVIVLRLPVGAPVVVGRSACDHCGRRLRLSELIPLVSWFVLRGRCATCRGEIDRAIPGLEAAAIIVPIWIGLSPIEAPLWSSLTLGWALS